MPIGEKISLRFEVACGKPVIYEWLKQGVKEDITVSPPECKIRSSITPIAIGKELTGNNIGIENDIVPIYRYRYHKAAIYYSEYGINYLMVKSVKKDWF